MNKIFTSAIVFIFSLFIFNSSFALDYYFTGAASRAWSNTANWTIGYHGSVASVRPHNTDNIFIGDGSINFTIDLDISDTITNLTIEGDGVIFINTTTSKRIFVLGDVLNENTNDVGGGNAVIEFFDSNDQNLSGNTTAIGLGKFPSILVEKSGGVLTLINYVTLCGSSFLSLNSGTVDATAAWVSCYYNNTIRGDWTFGNLEFVGTGASFTIEDDIVVLSGILLSDGGGPVVIDYAPIELQGDLDNENSDGSTVIHNPIIVTGGSRQSLIGSYALSADTIEINKTAESFTLATPLNINKKLVMTAGNIISDNTNLLTIKNGAVVVDAGAASFVEGPIKKTGNSSFKFNIGKNGVYNPVTISAPSSTSDEFVAEYFNEASSVTDLVAPITYAGKCEYHTLTHAAGSSAVNITLEWDNPCFHIASLSYFDIARDSSSKWVKGLGTFTTTGNTTTGTITSNTSRTTWGDITLAKTNPLVVANAGPDDVICAGSSAAIGGAAATTGTGGTGTLTYLWSPSTVLSSVTVANPTASPSVNTTYVVTVTDNISEFNRDTVVITSSPVAVAGSDKILCSGGDVFLGNAPTADGGTAPYTYAWSPSTGLDTTYIANPHCTTTATTTYTLTVTDDNGCTASDVVIVTISTAVTAHAGNDTTVTAYAHVRLGATVTASGGSGNYVYSWYSSAHLDSPAVIHPIAKLPRTQTLTLYVEDENGCSDEDDITITVSNPIPVFDAASGGVHFIENLGQIRDTAGTAITSIKYKSKLFNSQLYVRDTALTLMYSRIDTTSGIPDTNYIMNILFKNAATGSLTAAGSDTMEARVNYYLGSLPQNYEDVRTTRYIAYDNMYTGIDGYLFNTGGQMNWHFIADTIATPTAIHFKFEGADSVYMDSVGNVNITNPLDGFWWAPPLVTQFITGKTDTIASNYTVSGKTIGISLAAYNHHFPLDIYWNRPATNSVGAVLNGIYMDWSTYFGGGAYDYAQCVTNAFSPPFGLEPVVFDVAGATMSPTLPLPDISFGFANGLNGTAGNLNFDVFVAQFQHTTRELRYLTYFGGDPSGSYSGRDWVYGAAMGPLGKTYICGKTESQTFPYYKNAIANPNAYLRDNTQTNLVNGDGYVAAFDNHLTRLWASYLGQESCYGLTIDNTANPRQLIVVGRDDEAANDFDLLQSGGNYYSAGSYWVEGTIMQFNIANGANFGNLNWSTRFGGLDADFNLDASVDYFGHLAVGGITFSDNGGANGNFPILNVSGGGATSQVNFGGGNNDAFVALFNTYPNRNEVFCTYIGGNGNEAYQGSPYYWTPLKVGFFPPNSQTQSLIVAGVTNSTANFPVESQPIGSPFQQPNNGGDWDGFIQAYKVAPQSERYYSTFYGGAGEEQLYGLTCTPHAIYFAGSTRSSSGFPLVDFATVTGHDSYFQGSMNGGFMNGIVGRLNANLELQWSTYLGGAGGHPDLCMGINFRGPFVYVCGQATSHGTEIDNLGQPIAGQFPLCEFSNSTLIDFWQQYQDCPFSNSSFACPINAQSAFDGFITAFRDNCGAACYRMEDDEKETTSKPSAENLYVFPNPTLNSVYIEFNSVSEKAIADITLSNLMGQVLMRFKIKSGDNKRIDLSEFTQGIYFIRSNDGIESTTVKLIKQ